ncbi:PREDICTED: uncharacterized protein LOC109484813 [Branchiostoma belcheri]|uniref:Uncharacterized protein LOC109484813 n=1 Tax=Branchiostoma belcheri TaxID=7741 RepID=A0A6P5A2Y9_BRABE|nr:PREDICTED: uncharacterized protein LOC109484813 [Branchiostoma belcheri]
MYVNLEQCNCTSGGEMAVCSPIPPPECYDARYEFNVPSLTPYTCPNGPNCRNPEGLPILIPEGQTVYSNGNQCSCVTGGGMAVCTPIWPECFDYVNDDDPTHFPYICPNGPNCLNPHGVPLIPEGQTMYVNLEQCNCTTGGRMAVCSPIPPPWSECYDHVNDDDPTHFPYVCPNGPNCYNPHGGPPIPESQTMYVNLEQCNCTAGGETAVCAGVPPPVCVDVVIEWNVLSDSPYTCPNGPNCYNPHGGPPIPEGQTMYVNLEQCNCTTGGRMAVCAFVPPPVCVDVVIEWDVLSDSPYTCPNGPNCYNHHGPPIPAGQTVYVNNEHCSCVTAGSATVCVTTPAPTTTTTTTPVHTTPTPTI